MARRKQAEEEQARRRRRLFLGVLAGIVILAAAVAVLASGGGGDDKKTASTTATQTRAVTVTGNDLSRFGGDAAADPAVGTAIPTISGQSFAGQPVTIEANGKAKVLVALAHWCPHCQREVPLLSDSLRSKPLPANVEMMAVSTSVQPSAPNYPPESWLEREKWPTPVIADDARGTAGNALGLSSFPYFVFVDSQGKVVSRYAGEMPIEEFRATVSRLS